jgi:hypothetical protein
MAHRVALLGAEKRVHGKKAWFAAFSPLIAGYAMMTAPHDAPKTICRLAALWEADEIVYEVLLCFCCLKVAWRRRHWEDRAKTLGRQRKTRGRHVRLLALAPGPLALLLSSTFFISTILSLFRSYSRANE